MANDSLNPVLDLKGSQTLGQLGGGADRQGLNLWREITLVRAPEQLLLAPQGHGNFGGTGQQRDDPRASHWEGWRVTAPWLGKTRPSPT